MQFQAENFKRILIQISDHPETWYQRQWHADCGTAHCLAGWAQVHAGKPATIDSVEIDARRHLGLTANEAAWLFAPSRTFAEFEHFYKCKGTSDGYAVSSRLYDHAHRDYLGFDYDGFDVHGYSRKGRDREGYTANGWDEDGFNREGYNASGYDRNGFNRDGWDRDGFNVDGRHISD